MTRDDLLTWLSQLLPSQFEEVVFRANVPMGHIAGISATQTTRAIDVIRYIEQHNQLAQLTRILEDVAPGASPGAQVDSLLKLLSAKGGGGVKFVTIGAELGWKPSEVKRVVWELARMGIISLLVANEDEMVYRMLQDASVQIGESPESTTTASSSIDELAVFQREPIAASIALLKQKYAQSDSRGRAACRALLNMFPDLREDEFHAMRSAIHMLKTLPRVQGGPGEPGGAWFVTNLMLDMTPEINDWNWYAIQTRNTFQLARGDIAVRVVDALERLGRAHFAITSLGHDGVARKGNLMHATVDLLAEVMSFPDEGSGSTAIET